jgi:hypothetical protein
VHSTVLLRCGWPGDVDVFGGATEIASAIGTGAVAVLFAISISAGLGCDLSGALNMRRPPNVPPTWLLMKPETPARCPGDVDVG